MLHTFIEVDAKAMLRIFETSFGDLAHEYVLGPEDARTVIDKFIDSNDLPVKLRDMYASDDRSRFATKWLRPHVQPTGHGKTTHHASTGGTAASNSSALLHRQSNHSAPLATKLLTTDLLQINIQQICWLSVSHEIIHGSLGRR